MMSRHSVGRNRATRHELDRALDQATDLDLVEAIKEALAVRVGGLVKKTDVGSLSYETMQMVVWHQQVLK